MIGFHSCLQNALVHTVVRHLPTKFLEYSGVARICCEDGQSWKLGKGALRAGCSSGVMTNSSVINAVLIEKAVSC